MAYPENQVSDWYRGKTIFITGASGFMGKVLIEKLLYACPGLNKIYALMRPKRGKSVGQRVEEMFKLPMFKRVCDSNPDAIKKVEALQGDVLFDGLGLDAATTERIQKEINVIFHCAATLRLESNLTDAIEMNTTGTWRVIEICRPMKNLEVFVHLSTAFCYADLDKLGEKVLDWPNDPHDVMRCVKWMDCKAIDAITPSLLKIHPNTYTYSKRLAETLIKNEYPNMPMVIARPSIVCPAWEEPVEGWVDNLNGPVGLMIGAGKGVIRSMHCNGDFHAEVIPVDMAINALIVLAFRNGCLEKRPEEIPVYNLTTSDTKSTTWAEVLAMGRASVREYPFDNPLWYPDGDIRKNKTVHNLCVIFFHLLPAYFIDFLMLLFRQKRFMVRIQERISNGLEVLQFFTTREWYFDTNKFKDLFEKLSNKERKVFPMDLAKVEDSEYIKRCILGGRQYCLKEPLSSLPRARTVNNIMYYLDRFVSVMFYVLIVYWILKYSSTMRTLARALPVVGPYVMDD